MHSQPGTTKDLNPVVRGAQYRATHKASVMAILGDEAPRVSSKGCKFYNADRWTARFLIEALCKWAKGNPGCAPTRKTVDGWVAEANGKSFPASRREVVIAATPDKLPMNTALALIGGAYHEALHTKYSCRRNLAGHEVADIVLARWAKLDDWSRYHKALLDWSNIIEDIRIERLGCDFYDGIYPKMCDLADFVLAMEDEGRALAFKHTGKGPSALGIVMCAFRDIGKGYDTDRVQKAFEFYRDANPQALALVTKGPLAPLVQEAISLSADDDLGCLRIALDVIITLATLSDDDDEDGDDQGDGEPCPKCGADASKLKVQPKSDDKGGKVHGKGIITCTECGWQDEIDVAPKKKDKSEKGGKGHKFEDFDSDEYDLDPGEKDSASSGKGDKDSEGGEGEGGSKAKDSGDKSGGASGDDGTDTGEESGSGGGKDIGDQMSDDLAAGADSGMKDGSSALEEALGSANGPGMSSKDETSVNSGGGAGGHVDTSKIIVDNDWSGLAKELDAEVGKNTGVKDAGQALEDGIKEVVDKEKDGLLRNEALWRPFDTSRDVVKVVEPSNRGRSSDAEGAEFILASVKQEIAYLRSRLRTLVRSLEIRGVTRGVERGRRLSSRYLVDTRMAVRDGQKPKHAFDRKGEKVDMTMACAIVLDESGSMSGLKRDATRIMMALTEPLDALNAPTLVLGFRDIYDYGTPLDDAHDGTRYHRFGPVCYDIFKTFDERFRPVRWRFANTRADGGTPMADGVQFALNALSPRSEAHRILFVVTDGCPNGGHEQVINHQIRLAKEAGIHVIGIGIGHGASYVKTTFPDSVWSDKVADFPKLLLDKLNQIIDMQATKRGVMVKDTSR